uniref:hypothetical protein n=1 Tax=Paractinoplanes polyasparticus TaxID=2856853 RepID=UPI001C843FF6|nr:hypothetical protein [Actinoplanes polyasparticus]
MRSHPCPDAKPHGRHEWYWKNILRRDCAGVIGLVLPCGRDETHSQHWHGEYFDEWCWGSGLAGRCEHGEQMLNECEQCEAARPDLAAPRDAIDDDEFAAFNAVLRTAREGA